MNVLLPKTFIDLRNFVLHCKKNTKYEVRLFDDNSPYPRWIMRLDKPDDHITFLKIIEEGSEPIESIRIRFPNSRLGIHSYQVGIFDIQVYDTHKDVVPAIIFDSDKSIYDDAWLTYFDDCKDVQNILIDLLNNEEEYIVNDTWKSKFSDLKDYIIHVELNHEGRKNLFTEATANIFPKWILEVTDPEEGFIILKVDERDLEPQSIVKFVWSGSYTGLFIYPFDEDDNEDVSFYDDEDINKIKDVVDLGDNAVLVMDVILGMLNPLMIS